MATTSRWMTSLACLASSALVASSCPGDDSPVARPPAAVAPIAIPDVREVPAPTSPTPRVAFDRVAVIGASVTAGFMTALEATAPSAAAPVATTIPATPPRTERIAVNLADVVQRTLTAQTEPAASGGNLMFFANPAGIGGRLAKSAAEKDPTLVVAIDFPFWFGYGEIASPDESLRLKRLEEGLAMLDQFTCPIVIGDFPDMSESVGKMISKQQMPALETLVKLNERLHGWAKERPRVAVFPLDDLVRKLRSGEAITMGEHTWPAGSDLLQPDRLHPTVDGMIALGQQLAETLRSLDPSIDAAAFVRDPAVVRRRLQEVVDTKLAKRLEAAAKPG